MNRTQPPFVANVICYVYRPTECPLAEEVAGIHSLVSDNYLIHDNPTNETLMRLFQLEIKILHTWGIFACTLLAIK